MKFWIFGLGLLGSCFASGAPAFSFREEKLRISVASGRAITATLRVPMCAAAGGLSAILLFGGFEEAGRVLELIHLNTPLILASFDYPYEGKREFNFPETLREAGKLRQAVKDTQAGILALVQELQKRPEINRDQIAVVGASFGAPFAVRAAAEREEVRALVVVHGFADIPGTIAHRLTQLWSARWGRLAPWLAGFTARVIDWILDPPVPESDATRLRKSQNALMIEATEDTFIPLASRELLWQSLSRSSARVKRESMPGDHLQPGSRALIDQIIGISVRWMKGLGWGKSCRPPR